MIVLKTKNSLNRQLILSFTTVIAFSIFVFGIVQFFQVASLIEQNQNQQKLATQYLATNVYDFLDKHKQAVETIANFMSKEDSLTSEKGERLLSATKNNNTGFLNLYIADKNGTAKLFYPVYNNKGERNVGINFSDRFYFKEISKKKKTILTGVFKGRGGTTNPIIAIVSPIFNKKSEYVGYVLGAINLNEFSNQLLKQNYGQQATPIVIDQNNTIVFHIENELRMNLTSLSKDDVGILKSEKKEDGYYFSNLSNRKEYITYEEVPRYNWKIWLSVPAKAITNQYIVTFWKTGIFIFIITIFISILSYIFIKKIGKHLKQLVYYVHDTVLEDGITNSMLYEKLIDGPNEISLVAEKFRNLAISVQYNRKKLMELNEELEKRIMDRTKSLQKSNNELLAINKFIDSITSNDDIEGYVQKFLKEMDPIIPYKLHFIFKEVAVSAERIVFNINQQEYIDKVTNEVNSYMEPIYIQKDYIGFLVVNLNDHTIFSEGDLRFIKTLAKSFSIVIRNKLLFNLHRMKHAEFIAVLESMSEGVILINNYSKIFYCNTFIQQFLNIKIKDLMHLNESEFINLIEIKCSFSIDEYVEFKNGNTHSLKVRRKKEYGNENIYIIVRFNISLENDIYGQGYVMRDITKEEEIDFLKSNLISIASHEFKTPITTIKGSVETLLRLDANWDETFKYNLLEGIHEDIIRIQELVNDWLDISKIESGSMAINKEKISLDRIIEVAISQIPESQSPNICIKYTKLNEIAPILLLDKSRIIQVIVNLITNGIRYNDQKRKEIEISYQMKQDHIYMTVKDNGIGIASEYHEKIFDRFYRVDTSATRRTGGTGLGLAISKGIIKAHNGDLYVESELNFGSVFIIKLPILEGENNEI